MDFLSAPAPCNVSVQRFQNVEPKLLGKEFIIIKFLRKQPGELEHMIIILSQNVLVRSFFLESCSTNIV